MRRRLLGKARFVAAIAVMGAAICPPFALAQEIDAYGDGYVDGEAGRIRYHEGGATVFRAAGSLETDLSEATVSNAPVFAGDRVLTGSNQRVEVQLAGGSLIRIDGDSEVSFEALPRPYEDFRDNTVLSLAAGRVQIAASLLEDEEFRVDTVAGTVYLLGDGEFRIDAASGGPVRVVVRRGVAEVVGAGGSILVRGGMATTLFTGSVPAAPAPVSSFSKDGFDRWVDARDDTYRSSDRIAGSALPPAEQLPYEVRAYSRELSAHGAWIETPEYGWVWSPAVVVTDWRPYWDGYWAWGPRGYFWVSYEPWGWAPYRYGRWAWYGGRWCWIPGSAFAGAWVSWSWGTAWVGWAPLGYWGGPVYVGGPVYHGWYHPHCWTFVPPHHVVHHHVRRVAVPVNRVGSEVRRNAVVVRAPDVSPRRIATSVEAREAAARAASTDRVARLKTLAVEPRDELRPREIDRRLVTRNEAAARGDRGATAARPERSAPRATEGFSRRFVRGAPGDDRTAGQTPSASRKRSGTEVPSSPPVSSFPRRIVKDPRRGDESSPPSTSRVQPRQPQGESRVRDLYDRMSGPRQPRSVSPDKPSARSTRPDSQGPRAAPAQPAPSRKPTATPARPSPPRAPKAAPERGTPQESRGSGRRKGGSKKDGEKKR